MTADKTLCKYQASCLSAGYRMYDTNAGRGILNPSASQPVAARNYLSGPAWPAIGRAFTRRANRPAPCNRCVASHGEQAGHGYNTSANRLCPRSVL